MREWTRGWNATFRTQRASRLRAAAARHRRRDRTAGRSRRLGDADGKVGPAANDENDPRLMPGIVSHPYRRSRIRSRVTAAPEASYFFLSRLYQRSESGSPRFFITRPKR